MNPANNTDQDAYVDYLRKRRPTAAYLKPYWGNAGDELIWKGNEVLLRKLGIEEVFDPRRAEVIIWPGGNPTMWPLNLEGWRDCWASFPDKEFIIAPATFQGETLNWRSMLLETKARIGGVFARDQQSLGNLQKLNAPNLGVVGIGNDPAFHLRDSDWIKAHQDAGTAEYVLASFRSDTESKTPAFRGNRKPRRLMSALFRYCDRRRGAEFMRGRIEKVRSVSKSSLPLRTIDASTMNFVSFVETVRRAAEVHTDRLHCFILAALLKKRLFAYQTSYAKIEAVYDLSMKSWCDAEFIRDD